jgi:hypothetical protein
MSDVRLEMQNHDVLGEAPVSAGCRHLDIGSKVGFTEAVAHGGSGFGRVTGRAAFYEAPSVESSRS